VWRDRGVYETLAAFAVRTIMVAVDQHLENGGARLTAGGGGPVGTGAA